MFVAGRQIKVVRDGKAIVLNAGDPCPEAALYPHHVLANLMKVGQIMNVEKPSEVPPQALATQASQDAVDVSTKASKKSKSKKS